MNSGLATDITVQLATEAAGVPDSELFNRWVNLARQGASGEVTLRIVDEAESAELNSRYRDKLGATNVLSFESQDLVAEDEQRLLPPEVVAELAGELGDLVLCAPLVVAEAAQQGKATISHWAHLTVHGVLHLRGFDHQNEADQQQMELIEINLLKQLGFADPYLLEQPADD